MSHEPAVETQTTASTTSSSGGYSADGSNSDQSSHETVPTLAIHDVPLSRSRTQRRQYDHDQTHREDDDNESPHHPMHGRRSHRGGSSVPPSSPETRTGKRHPHAIPDNLLRDTPVADSGRFLDKPITHHDVDREAWLQQQPQPPDGTHSPVLPNHQKTVALAPWNGVRIHHPMDPRIDLSTVALLPCPHVPAPSFWEEPTKRSHAHDTIANHHYHHNHNNTAPTPSSHRSTPDPSPTIESYVQLLNAVRPFFQMPGVPLSPTTRTSTLDKHNIDDDDNVNPTGSPTPPHHPAHSFTQHDSSEGFTSFFTTTHSSTGHSHSNDTNTTASSENNRPRRTVGETVSVRNESSSAANLPQLPPGAPLVTDVSSSNPTDSVASTGISNPNTSAGSGSGGNTGSGSNQGSSGSGNEKGSSEEFLAKEDTTHSGEATNDGSERSDTNAATKPVPEQTTTPLRAPDPDETVQHDGVHRERKLLDKKRKRIEMRREYEAQQHLESSESSQPSDTDDILCPGTLVALHQVLTFSKTARILVRAIPPFVVEHTNAAYTRLTGIDSHAVVGKPLSSCMEILASESAKGSQSVREDGQSESSSNESVPSTELELTVAAGRAHVQVPPSRQPPSKIEMEVLVLSGGLCHFHLAHLTVRPHAMVDRKMAAGHAEQQKHDGAAPSRENSLTGNGASVRGKYSNEPLVLTCRISIAPVVSSPDSVTANEESELSQSKVKRKKYRTEASPNEEVHYRGISTGGSPHSNRKRRQLVTHYIIHLQREDHPCKASSFGSASAGADLLSQPLVSTAPKRDAGSLAQQPEAPVSTTERELVSAIG